MPKVKRTTSKTAKISGDEGTEVSQPRMSTRRKPLPDKNGNIVTRSARNRSPRESTDTSIGSDTGIEIGNHSKTDPSEGKSASSARVLSTGRKPASNDIEVDDNKDKKTVGEDKTSYADSESVADLSSLKDFEEGAAGGTSSQEEQSFNNFMNVDCEEISPNTKPITHNAPSKRGSTIDEKTCKYCGVVKRTPADLQRHILKHTGERPHQCQLCNASFKAKRSLRYHELQMHQYDSSQSHDTIKRKSPIENIEEDIQEKKVKLDNETKEGVMFLSLNENNSSPESGTDGDVAFVANYLNNDRVCQYCGKACNKPSDLKRHLMSHTGERPFSCSVCGKQFRAKNSMMYHQKAAHGMDIELTKGLQERYLRLQRSTRKFKRHQQYVRVDTPASNISNNSNDSLSRPEDSLPTNHTLHSTPVNSPGSPITIRKLETELDESTGYFKTKVANGDATEAEDSLVSPEVCSPALSGPSLVGLEINLESQFTSNRIRIKNETVLVTRLDGINTYTGKEASIYKCYLCGKIFTGLSKVQCHLSMHFDKELAIYMCQLCKSAFTSKFQVKQHVRMKHNCNVADKNDESVLDEVISPVNRSEEDSDEALSSDSGNDSQPRTDNLPNIVEENVDEEELKIIEMELKDNRDVNVCRYWCGLKYKKNTSGSYVCMQCRKSFHREISLLRHIKIHSTQRSIFCQQCGKGFSELTKLRQHLALGHGKGQGLRKSTTGRVNSVSDVVSKIKQKLEEHQEPETQDKDTAEKARELLMKEGIQEDVTVVMPCGPEDEPETDSGLCLKIESSWSEKDSEDSNGTDSQDSHIASAPKLPLIPEPTSHSSKSKRKSSQPVKLNSVADKSSVPSMSPLKIQVGEETITIKQEPLSPQQSSLSSAPLSASPSSQSKEVPTSSENANPKLAEFLTTPSLESRLNSFLMTAGDPTNSDNKQFGAALLLSNAALLHQMTSAAVPKLVTMPISIHVPSNSTSNGKTQAASNSATSIDDDTKISNPGKIGLDSDVGKDSLYGLPKVQWPNTSTESLDSSPGSANANWRNISITEDGRKVTSLSRTHSRLPIVKIPVNRAKVCKPTILDDGRHVYRCPFCLKDFLSYSDINRHMDFHEDIRPYKCKYCDYYARTNSQLKVHMMRHQGIREYCCKVCNYKGVTQSDLNRHMKSQIHLLKMRNLCSHCGEGFVTERNLSRHLNGNCIVMMQAEEEGILKEIKKEVIEVNN